MEKIRSWGEGLRELVTYNLYTINIQLVVNKEFTNGIKECIYQMEHWEIIAAPHFQYWPSNTNHFYYNKYLLFVFQNNCQPPEKSRSGCDSFKNTSSEKTGLLEDIKVTGIFSY